MTTLETISGIRARINTMPGRPPFMTAADLAEVYGTTPKRLGEAVKRNPDLFPDDFMFRLTEAEEAERWSHGATTSPGKRTDVRPLVFTHGGANMLAVVLTTRVAREMAVAVIRAFTEMERAALRDTRMMLQKLRAEALTKKPIYARIKLAAEAGWNFEELFANSNYSRAKLTGGVNEMIGMGMLPEPLAGMQGSLFDA